MWTSQCKGLKKRGVWTKHYTMTLVKNRDEMKAFAYSGAHKEAMKKSAELAKEIRTHTVESDQLMSWKEAIPVLQEGKIITY